MNKRAFLLLNSLLILLLMLTACGGSARQDASGTGSASTGQDTSLSQVNKLLVGTLRLETTDQAVTAQEAKQLLPLWQAYLSISNSQIAAEAEVDALLTQIQSTMTADQVAAIDAMNLTNQDLQDLMQSLGADLRPQGTPNPQGTPGFDFPQGGFQDGNPPDGPSSSGPGSQQGGFGGSRNGNFPPGGGVIVQGGPGGDAGSGLGLGGGQVIQGTPDPSMQATAQARFSTQANRVNVMLLNILILKLETMTGQ